MNAVYLFHRYILGFLVYCFMSQYTVAQITQNPIMDSYIADPNILVTDSCFFLFATGKEMPIWKSVDLIHWECKSSVYETALFLKPKENLWAPHFFKRNDVYVGYLSVWSGKPEMSYTVAITSDRPDRGYKLASIVLTKENTGVLNPIDACVYFEETSTPYVFFGSYYGIYRAELTDDCLSLKKKTSFTKVSSEGEGAYICKIGKWYYLFISKGFYNDDTYRIVYGRSSAIDGAFYDKKGKNLANDGGSILLQSCKDKLFYGPGHNGEIIKDKFGCYYMVYHAHYRKHKSNGAFRQLMISKLEIDKDGWIYAVDESSKRILCPSKCFRTPQIDFLFE